ncbi:Integral membrane protein [Cupriavidus necator H850]|uniref:DMT family transporter n=1 Tax=Cupriavidus TaxID=106589 RepID=UPI00129DD93C|nr:MULTISPECIES: DMT family transporter [Cupriavidus]KAI3605562.1 Integral membrane protein [Cupriavidus necator H850]QUN28574.1 DMT family transporter [Cupriavidus sp. KK10]
MSGTQLPFSLPVSLWLPLGTAVLAGAAIPFQAGANATLGRTLGHPLSATLVSLLVSLAALLPVLWLMRVPLPAPSALARGPGWLWIGGVLGVFYISAALMMAPRLGAAGFIAAVVAGQVLAALLVDQFGLAGFAVRALTPARLAGAALIVAGMLVMQWGSATASGPASQPAAESGS